jgi:secretion/DNA translocation related TadE-like protein
VTTERGSAGVLTAVLAMVVLLAAAVSAAWAGSLAVGAQARVAADLAALAAAGALQQSAQACPAADRVAAANGGRVTSCAVAGDVAVVAVSVQGRARLLGREVPVSAERSARAGPVTPAAPAGR